MRKAIAALCAGATLIGGGEAVAHTTRIPTEVVAIDSLAQPPGNVTFYGYLETRRQCRADRTVKLLYGYGGALTLVDEDRSSNNGSWSAFGPIESGGEFLDAARARVVRKNVGPRGHRHICQGDRTNLPLN